MYVNLTDSVGEEVHEDDDVVVVDLTDAVGEEVHDDVVFVNLTDAVGGKVMRLLSLFLT